MKVVINKCYGGFSLSSAAVIWLVENRPESPYLRKMALKEWCGDDRDTKLTAIPGTCWSKVDWFDDIITQDGETIWHQDFRWFHPHDDDPPEKQALGEYSGRSSQDLLDCLEALGCEKASGKHGQLEIVEIPDGIQFEIDEYDGIESIHECHRSWG